MVEGILERAHEKLDTFPAQSLSLLVHACARMQQKDVPLLTKAAKCIAPLLPEFTAQALAMTAYSFAKIEVRSEILFYLLAEQIIQKMPLFSGQGVGLALQAYGKLQIDNKKLVQACRKHVRALSDELTLWEVDAIEQGFEKLNALDGSSAALLRSLRRRLGSQHPAQADLWAEVEDSLLRRMAEEPPATKTPAVPSEPSEPSAPEREPRRVPDASLDLWELWKNADKDVKEAPVEGPEEGAATPPSRLREYLARPQQVGPKPVVLDEPGPEARGRKHRRKRT
ncbi:unnamed protein product [Effrenium voratum]|nr:unnamed protein product [Effrenium voratum]